MLRKTICALLAIACLTVSALAQTPGAAGDEKRLSFEEQLGADDGAVLAILYGANSLGNLDLCD